VPARRLLACAFLPLLGLLSLSGCSEQYPPDLPYGLRTDRIVDDSKVGKVKPKRLDIPGEFPHLLDQFAQEYKEETGDKQSPLSDPAKLKPELLSRLGSALDRHFNTPAEPRVRIEAPIEVQIEGEQKSLGPDEVITTLRLQPDFLAEGSKLYRRHCLHCHGLTGNGQGPTGAWVNPHPRDYRLGKFKFTSSKGSGTRKPRREDLLRTLRQGIEGTSMPTFNLLAEEQLQHLISYVMHLSMRGQVERLLLSENLLVDEPIAASQIDKEVANRLMDVCKQWLEAPDEVIKPESPKDLHVLDAADKGSPLLEQQKASVKNGQRLFLTGACLGCHNEYGRKQNLFWDDWGTIVRPANLTAGVYRGGRRPVDLFWRIKSGINGTVMPAAPGDMPQSEIWDLVNFLQVLPYPEMRKVYEIQID
jgi:mono/diheme cytochrome c family protein